MHRYIEATKTVTTALVVIFLYTVAVNKFYGYLFDRTFVNKGITANWGAYLLFSVVVTALWEEFVFRVAPLYLAYKYSLPVIYVVLFSSIIFGLGHGGMTGLCLQGFMGLVFSYVYVKEGYWAAVVTHGGWNFICGVVSF